MIPKKFYISRYAIEKQTQSINEVIHLLTKDCHHTDNIEAIRKLCDTLDYLNKLTDLKVQEELRKLK